MSITQVVEARLITRNDDLPVVEESLAGEAVKPPPDQANLFSISLLSEKTAEHIKYRRQQMSTMLKKSYNQLSQDRLPLEDFLVELEYLI